MKQAILSYEFVEFVPSSLQEGVLYVSMNYDVALHNCCCGCGNRVVTPLAPTDWALTYNGEGISLYPSIGNWDFPCKSHYWIEGNKVKWAGQWSQEKITAGRRKDQLAKRKYFGEVVTTPIEDVVTKPEIPFSENSTSESKHSKEGFWLKVWKMLTSKPSL